MPPDEYCYNVNNSVYTNAVAKLRYWESTTDTYTYSEQWRGKRLLYFFKSLSLQFAVELASRLQHPAPTEWQHVAEHLKIPFDEESQYHPEYDGYTKGYSNHKEIFIQRCKWSSVELCPSLCRLSGETGRCSDVVFPSGIDHVSRSEKDWLGDIRACHWPSRSSHDLGEEMLAGVVDWSQSWLWLAEKKTMFNC